MEPKEKILETISNQLDIISKSLDNLNERVYRLEGKTNDIHKYVPFVGWLEGTAVTLSNWSLFRSLEESPKGKLIKEEEKK